MPTPNPSVPVGYSFYRPEIMAAAVANSLDPMLVAAVCWEESSFNTDAFRFESDFFNRLIKPKGLYPGQNPRRVSSSYGLLQCMYPSAVELGYAGSPEGLFDPVVGLEWGSKRLRQMVDWANGFPGTPDQRLSAALAAYNGGRSTDNQPGKTPLRNGVYAASVLSKLAILKNASSSPT